MNENKDLYIPDHYTFRKMACDDLTSVILYYETDMRNAYYLGNIVKYIYRYPMKDKDKDITKLETYIKRYSTKCTYKFTGTIKMLIEKAMKSPTDNMSIESSTIDAELLVAVLMNKFTYALNLCKTIKDHYHKLRIQQLSVFDEPTPWDDDEDLAMAAMRRLEDTL